MPHRRTRLRVSVDFAGVPTAVVSPRPPAQVVNLVPFQQTLAHFVPVNSRLDKLAAAQKTHRRVELATAGGRASDAAAVRGDAGPDRACYRYRRDRWIVVESAAESVYKLVV
jgi:hypothetical protein